MQGEAVLPAASVTTLRLIDGLHFVGETPSGHAVDLDSRLAAEGPGAGASPMELQLVALGGCTAMDTISILRKMQQEVTAYEIRLTHERSAAHPRAYTAIRLTHVIKGRRVVEANVHRAIELTMIRYCPVFAMLHPTVPIRETYEISDEAGSSVVMGEVVPDYEAAPPQP
jgi:putative redox protein